MNQLAQFDDVMHESMKVLPRYFIPLPDGKSPYLERLVLRDKEVYLHVIYASDGDRDPHDHPFDFESTIIWGSYSEVVYKFTCSMTNCCDDLTYDEQGTCELGHQLTLSEDTPRTYTKGMVNRKRAAQLHRLTIIDGPVVTLVQRGPKVREWGFQTLDGWQLSRDYIAQKFPGAQPTEVNWI